MRHPARRRTVVRLWVKILPMEFQFDFGKEDIQVEDTSRIDPPFLNSASCGKVAAEDDIQMEDTSRIDPPFLNSASGGQVAAEDDIEMEDTSRIDPPFLNSASCGQVAGKEDIQVEDTSRIDPPFLNSSSCGQVAAEDDIEMEDTSRIDPSFLNSASCGQVADGEDTQLEDTSRIDPPFLNSTSGGQVAGKEDIQVEDTSCIDPPFLNSSSCGQVAGPCSCIAEEDNGTTGSQLDDIHIIVSGKSTLAEKREICKFFRFFKEVAKRHMKFSKTITHVVMITDSKNFICDRTMKYIQGIAHGCWVLSSEWLYKSLEAGFLLPEEKYVIRGDTVSGEEAIGPRNPMSASEAATGVLQAMSIYLHGFNERSKISREEVEDLIYCSGGQLLNSLSPNLSNAVMLTSEETMEDVSELDFKYFCCCKQIYGISTTTLSWLMDCIAEQKLHSPSDYLAAGDVEKRANEDTPNNENSAWIPKKDDGDIGEDSEEMQCYEEDGAYAYDDSDENTEDPGWIPGKSDEDDDGKNNEDNDITETEDLVGAFVVGMREKNKQDIAQDWIPGTSEEDDDNDDDFENEVVVPNIGVTCNNKILLQMARQTTKGRSAKQNICYYCEKPYSRISRHLIQVHNKEMEIAKILSFPKKSKERKTLWKEIVNKGNYKHNYDVMKNGNGEKVPKYRPRNTTNNPEPENCFSSYAPCEFCLGSYKKTDPWKYQKNCELKSSEKRSKANPIQMGKLLLPIVGTSKGFYENIFIKMRDDAVKLEIQKDPLVLQFAERLYEKNGANLHQHQYISQRLRELRRLLIQLKSDQTEITSIRTAINPINWDTLIHGIKTLAGLDEKKNTYKTPSLPLKLGHSLSKCAKILKTNAIIEENDADRKIADNFLTLYQSDWEERISAHALATLHDEKFNKPLLVPLAEDVVLLNSYLCTSAASLKESLKNGVDETKYSELAEVCLAQIILFNRKRSGEAARITINQYNEGLTNKPLNKEIEKSLSKFENELCKEPHKN
ncbi:uncharacterized protein [Magallana gigas]|uniref:uncharacterized protein isoform X3 n=1 Tax=Magallana gigas TaxID=29159 RepID=UPI00333F9A01